MAAVVKVKGIPIELDGTNYVVPPLALGALEQLQERLVKFNPDEFAGGMPDAKQLGVIVDAGHAALRRNYPDLTRERVADMIGLENMLEVFEAIMDVSGLKRKALEAASGEGPAGQTDRPTGPPSSPPSAPAQDGAGTT